MKWHPIESAPKDGTLVLVFIPEHEWRSQRFGATVSCAHFVRIRDPYTEAEYWKSWPSPRQLHKPTHWMPLPEPPEDTEQT